MTTIDSAAPHEGLLEQRPTQCGHVALALASGRTVWIAVDRAEDVIQIGTVGDGVGMRIRFDGDQPVVELTGARLSLRAIRSLELAAESIHLRAQAEMTVRSGGDLDVAAETIRLNC